MRPFGLALALAMILTASGLAAPGGSATGAGAGPDLPREVLELMEGLASTADLRQMVRQLEVMMKDGELALYMLARELKAEKVLKDLKVENPELADQNGILGRGERDRDAFKKLAEHLRQIALRIAALQEILSKTKGKTGPR